MKKHKKAILWGVCVFAALAVLATSPLWLFRVGTLITQYPGGYAASVESYAEIAEQAGKRDIFIPDLTDLADLVDEEVHVGYRMAMDSQFFWAKPDHCEVYIDLGHREAPTQYIFNRLNEEPSTGGELREYKGVTWYALQYDNQIKLGDVWYHVSGARTEEPDLLDTLTEFIVDQYLSRR